MLHFRAPGILLFFGRWMRARVVQRRLYVISSLGSLLPSNPGEGSPAEIVAPGSQNQIKIGTETESSAFSLHLSIIYHSRPYRCTHNHTCGQFSFINSPVRPNTCLTAGGTQRTLREPMQKIFLSQ